MEKTLQSKILYKGRLLTLRHDKIQTKKGEIAYREIVEHPGAVVILPILNENEIILIKQFRKALEKEIFEIPAGTLESGEEPLDCAQRELGEECGYKAGKLTELLQFYPSPGFCNERMILFEACDLEKTSQNLESDEIIEPFTATREQVKGWVQEGKIIDAKTLVGISVWLGLLS